MAQSTDFKYCYQLTRLELIKTTKELDENLDIVYGNQVVVNSLIQVIDDIIAGLDASMQQQKKK